ncbi:MAG: 6-carboxytetrahydropterin synthase [Planctomycetota bacterium]|jgi:6-pyruvoyltetrahydropterin/6-carboxytetrahydropterin synthase|nr:6-carboxytetrahydropterin synthase [Planctomycetota bacterium]
MERWAIQIDKEYLKYSCAHFLIFPDGSAERLHGHNYRVYVEVGGPLSEFGLVLDFQKTKPLIRDLVDALDEHWLIPGEHHELTWNQRDDGVVEVRYRERYYAAPKEDVIVLPINNTSVENMAAWLGRQLYKSLGEHFPEAQIDQMMLAVEENPGQRGVWRLER